MLEALAAACAESGDFSGAVKWQMKVIDHPTRAKENGEYERKILKDYEGKIPFRFDPTLKPRFK